MRGPKCLVNNRVELKTKALGISWGSSTESVHNIGFHLSVLRWYSSGIFDALIPRVYFAPNVYKNILIMYFFVRTEYRLNIHKNCDSSSEVVLKKRFHFFSIIFKNNLLRIEAFFQTSIFCTKDSSTSVRDSVHVFIICLYTERREKTLSLNTKMNIQWDYC